MRKFFIGFFTVQLFLCIKLYSQVWNPLGLGFQTNGVFSLLVFNDTLYAGGTFYSTSTTIDNISFWDDTQWNPIGQGMSGGVRCMTSYNNELYAAGNIFQLGGNQNVHRIVRWDGSNWSNLGNGITSGIVNDMITYNGELYVVGGISSIDSTNMIDIGKWNGSTWSPVCTMSGGLSELFSTAVLNNQLYIGGYFSSVNSQQMYNIARFDGNTWSDVGGGVLGDVFDMYADTANNRLYVVGNIVSLNGNTIPCPTNVAFWDGSSWNPMGTDPALHPDVIYQYNGEIYVGFSYPVVKNNGETLHFIAKWDGTEWQNVDSGVNNSVHALVNYENDLIVGGSFSQAGNLAANRIASWSDSTTSIENVPLYSDEIQVYPNPLNESTTVEVSESFSNLLPLQFELFDHTGKMVDSIEIIELKQQLNNKLNSGSYFYRILKKNKLYKEGKVLIIKN